MFDSGLVEEVLNQILTSAKTIRKRFRSIKSADDFLKNDRNLEKLDAICMQLITIGEGIKNLDKITSKTLLKKYPEFEWKKAMGMRDIITHHYFDLNNEVVFQVCKDEIPKLEKVLKKILREFGFA
jgi:uncharacterized protein with HEPN domain